MKSRFLFILLGLLLVVDGVGSSNVTYDGRPLIINGHHKILYSGSIHYPRSTPQMWPSLIAKAKAGGLDVIQTMVFWNLHEPQPGQFDFSGERDIVRFIKEIQAQALYACIRIGPFIQGEWSYGGLPFWLHDISGIIYRSDNETFKIKYQRVSKTVPVTDTPLRFGVMAVPNGKVCDKDSELNESRKTQNIALDPVVSLQLLWTNLRTLIICSHNNHWSLVLIIYSKHILIFYQVYGDEPDIRSAEDIAFHVALFIAKKGNYVNYYMIRKSIQNLNDLYHGGINFGRTTAAYILTSYYDQAPLDEYALFRLPKWGHLKELHAAIKLWINPLLSGVHTTLDFGRSQVDSGAYLERRVAGINTVRVQGEHGTGFVSQPCFLLRYWIKLPQHNPRILNLEKTNQCGDEG
ncbi:hypothetical protein GQ457_12G015920 [Hibiscus cannabinus]